MSPEQRTKGPCGTLKCNMRRLLFLFPLTMLLAFAQDEKAHHEAMEVADSSMKAIQAGVKAGDGAAVSKAALKIHAAFPEVEKFWIAKKSDVGIKASKDSLVALKALADTAATPGVTSEDMLAKVKAVGAACRSCHTQHREKNAEGKYVFKY